jgi:hypothetical protein
MGLREFVGDRLTCMTKLPVALQAVWRFKNNIPYLMPGGDSLFRVARLYDPPTLFDPVDGHH